jgi:hypothetical protein
VSDAAHHCVQLRIDLLFTMSDNLPRNDLQSLRGKFRCMDEFHCELKCKPRTSNPAPHELVEPDGIEPTTSCLQSRRSPN